MTTCRSIGRIALLGLAAAWLSGCRAGVQVAPPPAPPAPPSAEAAVAAVVRTGYAVQVGAFAVLENARKLARALNDRGLDAYFFPQTSGLYKVRFGDFRSRADAEKEARRLRAEGVIDEYFIAGPVDHPVYGRPAPGEDLRARLAATAESFIGIEYSWGGTSSREGFDCSGLVRAVYQLNGIDLPRSAADQFRVGTAVSRDRLRKGDLVFFSASPGGPLSHVGICVGKGLFVHAPGTGKNVREDSLESGHFKARFSGARTYLR